ncbi:transketolase C-terminal domain-containing protein [Micromonospora sp. NPDC050980]|uniref:transketolase family protein n=1 Tax=Micromonospora sp. NPDC050980 TaxID=3155161 RepID=UPI0033F41065
MSDAPSQKDAHIAALGAVMADRDDVWCLDSDVGGYRTTLGGRFPDRYRDFGIAEATMIGAAGGLAATGQMPFAHSLAGFAAVRAFEQLKLDVVAPGLPVRVVATHSGLSAGHYGSSHHVCEDVAALRALPGLTVLTPADAVSTGLLVAALADHPGPAYLRLGRKAVPPVYPPDAVLRIGEAVRLAPGDDVTVLASGPVPVQVALAAHRALAADGVGAGVLDVHTVAPLDTAAVIDAARRSRLLVTVEDHSTVGGLGSAVAETVAELAPCRVVRAGVASPPAGGVGGHEELLSRVGVSAASLAATIRGTLARH